MILIVNSKYAVFLLKTKIFKQINNKNPTMELFYYISTKYN